MKSNLDVWAIQYFPEEIENALDNIKEGINIIYSNCVCDFIIGNQNIKTRKFDTFLYNEKSDILIMLMRGGKITTDNLTKKLEKRKKKYVEVTFKPFAKTYKDADNLPEIWFAREKYVLEDALKDSIENNITSCEYYPCILGKVDLSYLTKYNEKIEIDGRIIKGLIKLEDKIILLINNKYNLEPKEILVTLKDYNIETNIYIDKEPDLFVKNFSKKLLKYKKSRNNCL